MMVLWVGWGVASESNGKEGQGTGEREQRERADEDK